MTSALEARKKTLERRRALTSTQVSEMSARLWAQFFAVCHPPQKSWKGLRIALYRPMPGEPLFEGLVEQWRSDGATLCFPRLIEDSLKKQSGVLEMVEVPEPDRSGSWVKGPYGIEQPQADLPAIDPGDLDLISVPGTAFGLKGERVGMGAGFYDRYLAKAPQALRIGLCFDFQFYESIEQQSWDMPVHWVITEKRQVCAAPEKCRSWK